MIELRTTRLLLRAPRPEDAPCYALGVGDYDVARWLTPMPWPYSLAMARDWLFQAQSQRPGKAVFIVEKLGQGLVGGISLLDELGFWIARSHWGRGYAGEAAEALLRWHFAGSGDALAASAQHDNHASLRVQQRLGFVEAGRERRFSQALQHNVDHVLTRLTQEHWLAREQRQCR
ncbi:MAG: hypothetical protein ABS75_19065 [Pelagibacterium sp. SCN 63-23]|nr:MAG: hypothetical protein ABS75_19065 [Pelagibacterium sp. SCN 63-23]